MQDAETVKAIADLVKVVTGLPVFREPHAHLRAWFRGQGNIDWALEPGVCRETSPKVRKSRIRESVTLAREFEAGSAGKRQQDNSFAEIYMMQQHYGVPTRLLDWSRSSLIALFSCIEQMESKSGSDKADGALYAIDAYAFDNWNRRGLFTSDSSEVAEAMKAFYCWKDVCWPEKIYPIYPVSSGSRIAAQRGFFTIHPPQRPRLEAESNKTLQRIVVPYAKREDLRKELDLLGVDEFVAYGGLDHLAKVIRRSHRPLVSLAAPTTGSTVGSTPKTQD